MVSIIGLKNVLKYPETVRTYSIFWFHKIGLIWLSEDAHSTLFSYHIRKKQQLLEIDSLSNYTLQQQRNKWNLVVVKILYKVLRNHF